MNKFLKLYLSTLVGFLAYCLTYMTSAIFAVLFIGYDKILKNQENTRFSFIFISSVILILVFTFIYRLINKIIKKESNI